MKKVIVCGGRKFTDKVLVWNFLDALMEREEGHIFIIQGGATGADTLAEEWAKKRGCPCAKVEANWNKYSNSAGPRRNKWMLELLPDMVVAFKGGSGTQNMIRQAEDAGFFVVKVGW